RPLQLERIAHYRLRVEISANGPGVNPLARLLPHLPEVLDRSLRWRDPQLLCELPPRRRQRVLAAVILALGDRPGADVATRPEGSARVDKQHLHPTRASAVQEDPGARGRHL